MPPARVAEAVAAEAMSSPAWEPPTPAPPSNRPAGDRAEPFIRTFEAAHGTAEGFSWIAPPPRPATSADDPLLVDLAAADAYDIDARLRTVREAMLCFVV